MGPGANGIAPLIGSACRTRPVKHHLANARRQDELLALRWDDVDLEEPKLRVRHTLARVNGTLGLLEPKTRTKSPHGDPARCFHHGAARPPNSSAHGTTSGWVALGGQRPCLCDDHRYPDRGGGGHPRIPKGAGAGGSAA